MSWKKFVKFTIGSAIAFGASFGGYHAYTYINDYIKCNKEITIKHSRKQIEEIIKEIKTPKEAFYRVSKDLIITEKADEIAGCGMGKRRMSMQESYALGYGDCVEGALAFAAMLSDNPEYNVRFFSLRQGNDSIWTAKDEEIQEEDKTFLHLIASYEINSKLGIVSFNNVSNERELIKNFKDNFFLLKEGEIYFDDRYPKDVFNFITDAKFKSLDGAIIAFNNETNLGGNIEYTEIFLNLNLVKFGKGL